MKCPLESGITVISTMESKGKILRLKFMLPNRMSVKSFYGSLNVSKLSHSSPRFMGHIWVLESLRTNLVVMKCQG